MNAARPVTRGQKGTIRAEGNRLHLGTKPDSSWMSRPLAGSQSLTV